MKTLYPLIIVVALNFAGCASAPLTPQQKIASVGRSYEESNRQLSDAEKALANFEESLAKLRDKGANSKDMRSKNEYDAALARLENRLAQTRVDLQYLKDSNKQGAAEYKRQLENAATQIQQTSNKNQDQ